MSASLPATDLEGLAARDWGAVVVGAGPAGALAARQLALAGERVLLVDKEDFPRSKVCGACLHPRALTTLEAVGLGALPARLGARRATQVEVGVDGTRARLGLKGTLVLSREALDASLMEAAREAGATLATRTTAKLGPCEGARRGVLLESGARRARVEAAVAIAADGLAGSFASTARGRPRPSPRSLIGAGAQLPQATGASPGTVRMACGPDGYLGASVLEDGRLNLAAAWKPEAVARHGLEDLARRTWESAGFSNLPGLEEARWRGTPALTRRSRRPAGERLFLLGDASGYVEPFTGEGIAWALEGAALAQPLASRAIRRWEPGLAQAWARLHRRHFRRRFGASAWVAGLVRRPRLLRALLASCRRVPLLGRSVLQMGYGAGRLEGASWRS